MISHTDLTSSGFKLVDPAVPNFYCDASREVAESYLDGSERDILEILQTTEDIGITSDELRKAATTWPRRYHLGRRRANLLAPLRPFLNGTILEIGAGCGALTRAFAETGLQTVSIEPSFSRTRVAAERVRDLNNVVVVNSSLADFKTDAKFDVATLIGVLEYAQVNFGDNLPGSNVQALLQSALDKLSPSGKLVIAIENQLGLKYFAGYPEDHIGIPMYGLEDRYTDKTVLTFGKRELENILCQAGLVFQQWWYPWPDYKLPTTFVSDLGAEKHGKSLGPLLADAVLQDQQQPAGRNFSLQRALPLIAKNGLSADLANSFLIIASRLEMPPSASALIYVNNDLRPQFAKAVEIAEGDRGELEVRRSRLHSDAPPAPLPVEQILVDVECFLHGTRWFDRLTELLAADHWSLADIFKWTDAWWKALLSGGNARFCDHDLMFGRELLDAIPRNLIRTDDGDWHFFDLEWRPSEPISADFLIFRAMLDSLSSVQKYGIPRDGDIGMLALIRRILDRYGFPCSWARVRELYEREIMIYRNVYGALGNEISFVELADIKLTAGFRR